MVHGGLTRVGTSTLPPVYVMLNGNRSLSALERALEKVLGIGFGLFLLLRDLLKRCFVLFVQVKNLTVDYINTLPYQAGLLNA